MVDKHCPMTSARAAGAVKDTDPIQEGVRSGAFFTAAEARRRVEKLQASLVEKVFSEGIKPAVADGRNKCVVKVVEQGKVPNWILGFLESLGYAVQFLQVRTPESGCGPSSFVWDYTTLLISWTGCEIHEPEK